MLSLLASMFRLLGGQRLAPRVLAERWQNLVTATTGLTNLGRLAIETHHGPLTIEACHFATSPSALGLFMATATSLGGRIFWNFIWPDPTLTQPHAAALVASIVKRLEIETQS